MFRITNKSTRDKTQSTQTENQNALSATGGVNRGRVGGNIKNLSTIANLTKSKKLKSKANFAKANFGTDFLTSGAKETFIYLQKAFIEAPILRHFDPKHYIRIETDVSGYAISGVLNQMTSNHSDQLFFDQVTHKNLGSISLKSEICQ